MSEMVNRGVEVLKRLPVRDREAPGSELDELRLREAVRAVIAAMREPTSAIIFVLDEALHGDPGHNEMPTGKRLTDTREWWQAMIDAALK